MFSGCLGSFQHGIFLLLCLAISSWNSVSASTTAALSSVEFQLNENFLLSDKAFNVTELLRKYNKAKRQMEYMEQESYRRISAHDGAKETSFLHRHGRLPEWFHGWLTDYKAKHKELLKNGKSKAACIIPDKTVREHCCLESVRSSSRHHHHKKSYFKKLENKMVLRCMVLIDKHFARLERISLKLSASDEMELQNELGRFIQSLPKELQPDVDGLAGETSSVFDNEYEVAQKKKNLAKKAQQVLKNKKKSARARRKYRKDEREHRRVSSNIQRLADFLIAMKKAEREFFKSHRKKETSKIDEADRNWSIKKGKKIKKSKKDKEHKVDENYITKFLDGFRSLYNSKNTGVFYHGVERRWMTCGLISYKPGISSSYCAYLRNVDPKAPELGRKPVFGWESGLQAQLEKADQPEPSYDGPVDHVERHLEHSHKTEANGKYVEVDLFGSSSKCSQANLAYGCYAMCCDSVFAYSQFCSTNNLRCIC